MTRGKNPGLPVAAADGQNSEGEEAAAYEVGYGRPPREHRFQPGRAAGRKAPATWHPSSRRRSVSGSW
jgi:hypothetical protein